MRAAQEKGAKETGDRLARIEESIRNIGVVELLRQIETLNAEIARLRGANEVLANQVEQVQKRQRDFYLDLDSRLKRVEGVPAAQPAGAPDAAAPPAVAAADPAAAAPKPPSKEEQAREVKAYDAASGLFRRNDFASRPSTFRAFLKEFPAEKRAFSAPNATLLDRHLLRPRLHDHSALATQEGLISRFPQSPKARRTPRRSLRSPPCRPSRRLACSACNTLEDIIARHPASEAAGKARTRLGWPRGARGRHKGAKSRRPPLRRARLCYGARDGAARKGSRATLSADYGQRRAELAVAAAAVAWPCAIEHRIARAWTSGAPAAFRPSPTGRSRFPRSPDGRHPLSPMCRRAQHHLPRLGLAFAECDRGRRDLHRRQCRGLPGYPTAARTRASRPWRTSPRSGPPRVSSPESPSAPRSRFSKADIVRRGTGWAWTSPHGVLLRRADEAAPAGAVTPAACAGGFRGCRGIAGLRTRYRPGWAPEALPIRKASLGRGWAGGGAFPIMDDQPGRAPREHCRLEPARRRRLVRLRHRVRLRRRGAAHQLLHHGGDLRHREHGQLGPHAHVDARHGRGHRRRRGAAARGPGRPLEVDLHAAELRRPSLPSSAASPSAWA